MPRTPIIAIVDDDPFMRDALVDLLQSMAFETRSFDGPGSLLAEITPGSFDCVLSDIRMPGMDGLELQRRLADFDAGLPIVFVTSVEDPSARRTALAQGAHAVLPKPVNARDLQRELGAALRPA